MQLRRLLASQEWGQHVAAMQQYAFVYLPENGVLQTAAMADRSDLGLHCCYDVFAWCSHALTAACLSICACQKGAGAECSNGW